MSLGHKKTAPYKVELLPVRDMVGKPPYDSGRVNGALVAYLEEQLKDGWELVSVVDDRYIFRAK